ncbi:MULTISPECIES: peptidase domain-containing ABC transporter [unclassified Caballeronia]|uniref:peptidase domain-containing ABC transporter n=1 Tax=unclassified Caballeronia TaxID=2646786 RepID=UPI00285FDB1B|nr:MULTISPECIES: peptidase domain-containing ABC transporter [unclassified Caballeronia]MDR5817729.1 peptidase domain-containing ABC transporter [Caballeronia sp. LZ033]MDR5824670.1 peptidase domain-containing ABC transporter [Caballeronia sp. LZ043]
MRVIYQNEVAECGYACLAMVLSHLGRATEVRELSAYKPISANGLSLMDLYDVAVDFGLAVQAYRFDPSHLSEVKKGSILHFGGAHFVVFEKVSRGYISILDPATGRRRVSMDTFRSAISGFLLEFSPTPEMPRIRAKSRVPAALKRVRAFSPQLKRQTAKVLFVALGSQFAILSMPYFGNLTLDHVVAADNRNLLNVLIMSFASIFLLGALSEYVQKYLTELLYTLTQINSTEGVVRHLLRNPMSWFEKRHVGDVFARVKAQDEISAYATRSAITLHIDLAVGVLALVLMLIQSAQLTFIALAVFALYVLIALSMYPAMRDTHALVLETSARCDDSLIETIRAASLLKLAQGETRRTAIHMTLFKAYASALLQSSRLACRRDGFLKLVNYADTLVITWMAARLMLGGKISVGVFYSFLIYKSLMSERLASAIGAMFQYFMLSVPTARVDDIVECENERYTPLPDTQRATEVRQFDCIDVRNVTFKYGISDQPVLRDASFRISKGDKIVITGPSGSGKSTLFKLLSAAEPLQDGQIVLNGIAWPNLAVDEIRRHQAHMRQGDIILHGSIADNITLFAGQTDEDRVHAILDDVGLLPDVMRLPMRTRTVISDTIANISAGQRQRLLLARALYQQREVLLLDEPTSNLDPVSVQHIATLLRNLNRTVVVITHDMSLASWFDIRYRFEDGALVREDAGAEQEAAYA